VSDINNRTVVAIFAVYVVLAFLLVAGVVVVDIFFGGMEPPSGDAEVSVTEDNETGVVVVRVTDVGSLDGLNVTTLEGGGTGELVENVSTGNIVALEASDTPEWRKSGVGEYAEDGDEIVFVGLFGDSRHVVYSYKTADEG
jgi:hypothetical protein